MNKKFVKIIRIIVWGSISAVIAFLAFCVILAWYYKDHVDELSLPDAYVKQELELDYWAENRVKIWVGAMLDNHPIRLLVDTGDNRTELSATMLLDLGYALNEKEHKDSNRLLALYNYKKANLSIGPIKIRGSAKQAHDYDTHFSVRDYPLDGILGTDIYRKHGAIISYAHSAIYLKPENLDTNPTKGTREELKIPYGYKRYNIEYTYSCNKCKTGQRLWFVTTFDGQRLVIDSGADVTILNAKLLRELGYELTKTEGKTDFGQYNQRFSTYLCKKGALKIGLTNYNNVQTSDFPESLSKMDGIIGNDILLPLKAIISFDDSAIYFKHSQW